jgi:chromosome segregation ATPase
MMIWPMLLDLVVAGLLVATITYAVRLNRRLGVLREDRQQLQEMIKGLETATRQAEEAVGGLRLGAADAGKALHEVVEKAQGLKADLLFITERANGAADRLEAALKAQRDTAPTQPLQAQVAQAQGPIAGTHMTGAMQEQRRRPRIEMEPGATDAKGAQSRLANLLKQAEAAPPPRPPAPSPTVEPERPAPQSRAERDLLRALEGRR